MRLCADPDCLKPALEGALCYAHSKRKKRGEPPTGPLAERHKTWRRLLTEAALAYAEAVEDDEYERAWNRLRIAAVRFTLKRRSS